MTRTTCRVFVSMLALSLAGCAQFTTSSAERAGLQSAADAANAAYLGCLDEQADRYLGTSEDVRAIVTLAVRNCASAREAAGRAQSELQATNYILSEREVEAALKSLDAQGEAAITGKVLNRKAAMPAATAAPAVAIPAPAAPATGNGYLACMQSQGERWANVQEPATVIAESAHGRCAGQLAGNDSAAELEKQGRALVTGIVLDRKAQ